MEKKSKEVKKATAPSEAQEVKKPSYEELEAALQTLNQHCKELYQKLQEADKIIGNFNDIGILLSILKQSEYFDESFIGRCAGKIQGVITQMLDSAEEPSESSN